MPLRDIKNLQISSPIAQLITKSLQLNLYARFGMNWRMRHRCTEIDFLLFTFMHLQCYKYDFKREILQNVQLYKNANKCLLKLLSDNYKCKSMRKHLSFEVLLSLHKEIDLVVKPSYAS